MRLIDADAVLQYIREKLSMFDSVEGKMGLVPTTIRNDLQGFVETILEQPTVPAAPRWVRCDEAKPQNKTRCLLAIPTAVKSPDYKHYYEIGYYDGGHFTAYNSELGFIQLEPEWWKPIEPPKEDA